MVWFGGMYFLWNRATRTTASLPPSASITLNQINNTSCIQVDATTDWHLQERYTYSGMTERHNDCITNWCHDWLHMRCVNGCHIEKVSRGISTWFIYPFSVFALVPYRPFNVECFFDAIGTLRVMNSSHRFLIAPQCWGFLIRWSVIVVSLTPYPWLSYTPNRVG